MYFPLRCCGLLAVLLALANPGAALAQPMDSMFMFQGELRLGAQPSHGPHDFEIALHAEEHGGVPLDTLAFDAVEVNQGLFSLPLDFTGAPFEAGLRYWVEVRVRPSGLALPYTTLAPRQRLTATPYALTALAVRPGSIGASEINPSAVQRRVSGACTGPRQSIKSISETGTVTCETHGGGTVTNVDAGFGLNGGGSTAVNLAVDPFTIQRRVSGNCQPGSSIRAIAQDGAVTCEPNNPTGFTGHQIVTFETTYSGAHGVTSVGEGEARCPWPKRVIGGGVQAGCGGAYVYNSYPRNLTNSSGWWGSVLKRSDAACPGTPTVTVYAICANVN
jgi:hypothetical protein